LQYDGLSTMIVQMFAQARPLLLLLAGCAFAQQAHVNLDWAPHKNTQGLKPYGASVLSPEVSDDHTITFRVKAPDAQRVELTGGPMLLALGRAGKNVPFTKGDDGVWSLSVGPVKPNLYVYKFVIDGATVPDPNNTLTGFADQPGYSTVLYMATARRITMLATSLTAQ
jgi:1,4-alpha-glucan branching enzyme